MVNLPCLKESCPNFLRPTRPYIENLLSFQTGSLPTERTTVSYSSCVFFEFTDLPTPQGTDILWMLTLPSFAGHCDDAAPVALHRYRVSFQNPAQSRKNPKTDKALEKILLPTVLRFLFLSIFELVLV